MAQNAAMDSIQFFQLPSDTTDARNFIENQILVKESSSVDVLIIDVIW